jgi:hypothetical protein
MMSVDSLITTFDVSLLALQGVVGMGEAQWHSQAGTYNTLGLKQISISIDAPIYLFRDTYVSFIVVQIS